MAGHLASKKPKLAKIEGPNCKKRLNPLPIKGRAENSAPIKAQTQPNAAKISAPNSSIRSLKTVSHSRSKPSEILCEIKGKCYRVLCV